GGRCALQQRRPHLAAGHRPARPAGAVVGLRAPPGTGHLPGVRTPRSRGAGDQPGGRLRRRHRGRRHAGDAHRTGDRHAHLGRGGRHRRTLRPGRRDRGHQPKYATWFEGAEWSIENYGVDPDIEVTFPPNAWISGEDPQLERGVTEALALLEEEPAAVAPPLPAPRFGPRSR